MNASSTAQTRPIIILVTGGCGYLGSQLIRDLADDGGSNRYSVRILDNMQSGNFRALMNLPAGCAYQFIEGDILDPSVTRLALRDVDAVIHLAANVRTPMSFEHPSWVEQVNHWGTAQLVEACLEMGVQRFIYASTAAVYGPGENFNEEDTCRPLGPYAQSKYQAEKSISSASRRGLQATILRIGTIYGLAPVTRFDAVANRFAYLAGIGRSLTIYGSGDQARPFIHVRDASRIIRFCLANQERTSGEIINAIGENASVQNLARAVLDIKPDAKQHYTEQDILTHLSFQVNPGKLASLGWKPELSLREGLAELIGQFKNLEPITAPASSYDLDF